MKKIIRVLFFAFALVLFTGTVNAEETVEKIKDQNGDKYLLKYL